MALVSHSFLVDLALFFTTCLAAIYMYFKYAHTYWKQKGIPYLEPRFPAGTMNMPLGKLVSFGEQLVQQYNESLEKGYKYVGLYVLTTPIFMPVDVEMIKNIMTRDFDHFVDRGVYFNERDDPLSAHLFSIEGAKWRHLRVKLSPTFTSGKIKMMFGTLVQCGAQLQELMEELTAKSKPVDIKDVVARFTTDIIGSCAFGIDCNSCKTPNSGFRIYGKRAFNATRSEMLKGLIGFSNRKLAQFLGFTITPKESSDFFLNLLKETVEYREANKVDRKDFMKLLLDIKNEKPDGSGLTFNELAAQAFVFFLAGFETSSTTMTFCLYELSLNPDIQERVRNEIKTVLEKHQDQMTYESMIEMKYMEQTINETLRKYPPLPSLNRKCTKEYRIPGTDLVLEKDTPVILPILAIQRDKQFFPDPEKFDPYRFSDENKDLIRPFTFLPFGEGPRICIGLRFGMLQTKVGLTILLKNYKFSLHENTKTPIEYDPHSFILAANGDVWLKAERISS